MGDSSDQLNIETPELVEIEMPLAGIGSRFIALLVDYLIWGAGFLVLSVLFAVFTPAISAFSNLTEQWTIAIATFLIFLLNWGYFTLFEAFCNGRTPGKRVARIRVIQRTGRAIGLFESMARNLVRYVDQIPFFYAVGVISVFATRQHQRLGDLVAGTLVVRERVEETALWGNSGARSITGQSLAMPTATSLAQGATQGSAPAAWMQEPHLAISLPVTSVAKLTAEDLQVLEGFLARRLDMSLPTRQAIAEKIAAAIQAKSGLEQPEGASVETFLEATTRQLRDIARMQ